MSVQKPASHPPFLGGTSASQAMGLGRCSSGGEVGGHGPVRYSFFLGTSGPLGLLGPLGPLGPGCFILVISKASPMTDLLGSDHPPDSHLAE